MGEYEQGKGEGGGSVEGCEWEVSVSREVGGTESKGV